VSGGLKTLYFSVRPREALKRQMSDLPLGFAHYSYGIVCRRFVNVIEDLGYDAVELPMPEIFANARTSGPAPDTGERPIHFMFKAFDEFRILKGAYNIGCIYWEYTRLPSFARMPQFHPKRGHPLNDYIHALSLADEVWVACSFTRDVLLREGIKNVHIVPAPVDLPPQLTKRAAGRARGPAAMDSPLQIVEATRSGIRAAQLDNPRPVTGMSLFMRIAARKQNGGKVFVSAFNPYDPRKNSGAMLAGFQAHARKQPGKDMLIVKLLVDGKHQTLQDAVKTVLPRWYSEVYGAFETLDCEDIYFICGYMTDLEMDQLYRTGDFYLCTSNAEGQNMPILESMSRGGIPVSPANTAMADYINSETAVVIPSTPAPIHNLIAETYGLADAEWQDVAVSDVATAITRAASMSPAALDAMREAATAIVQERYSTSTISRLIGERLRAIQRLPSPALV
jgi:hypothetical protein